MFLKENAFSTSSFTGFRRKAVKARVAVESFVLIVLSAEKSAKVFYGRVMPHAIAFGEQQVHVPLEFSFRDAYGIDQSTFRGGCDGRCFYGLVATFVIERSINIRVAVVDLGIIVDKIGNSTVVVRIDIAVAIARIRFVVEKGCTLSSPPPSRLYRKN